MFDIAKLDILTPSEEGRPMRLVHPLTGNPWKRADGTPIHILLRGRNCSLARAELREIGNERAAMEADGRTPTPEQLEAWNTRYLVAMTAGWNFDEMDGQPFPFNAANAEKMWTDARLVWLRPRALGFISEDGNFLGA